MPLWHIQYKTYYILSNVLCWSHLQYLPLPNLPNPSVSPKASYGEVTLTPILRLFDAFSRELLGTRPLESENPLTFESLGVFCWLVLYEAELPNFESPELILRAIPRDRALVYVNGSLTGVLSRTHKIESLTINQTESETLRRIEILVENQGHNNFGNISAEDYKVSIGSKIDTKAYSILFSSEILKFRWIYFFKIHILWIYHFSWHNLSRFGTKMYAKEKFLFFPCVWDFSYAPCLYKKKNLWRLRLSKIFFYLI